MKEEQRKFVWLASKDYGAQSVIDRTQVQLVCDHYGLTYPYWFTRECRTENNGKYRLPDIGFTEDNLERSTDMIIDSTMTVAETIQKLSAPPTDPPSANIVRRAQLFDETVLKIPDHFTGYVPFGFYKDLKSLFVSKMFFPVMIVGLSGNGKTLMPLEAAYEAGRELIRVNVTVETDENQLIGGAELVDGNTVNRKGPVLVAMEEGAILLLDEIDRGSNKLMCLQGILEGNPYYDKNTGKTIYPKEGFNIIATANTKGRGSEDGRFLANILDEAFLERFPITIEQDYPTSATEEKILNGVLKQLNHTDDDFTKKLTDWADNVRTAFKEGSVNELISTRRLVDICKAFSIYGERMKAIQYCTNRFDDESKSAFIEFYTAIDDKTLNPSNIPVNEDTVVNIWVEEAQTP